MSEAVTTRDTDRQVDPALPFGVAVAARASGSVETVDDDALVYDADQQIMLLRDGDTDVLVPWCKHTDGPTSTDKRSDGNRGPEYDTDHRED